MLARIQHGPVARTVADAEIRSPADGIKDARDFAGIGRQWKLQAAGQPKSTDAFSDSEA